MKIHPPINKNPKHNLVQILSYQTFSTGKPMQSWGNMSSDEEEINWSTELEENERLKDLYSKRLELLWNRNPNLELVRQGLSHLYDEYEQHFIRKIAFFEDCIKEARQRLNLD